MARSFPEKHKKNLEIEKIPESLKDAILIFLLSCAIRHSRGDLNVHQTMLIHVTLFTDVQNQIVEAVEDFIEELYGKFAVPSISGLDVSIKNRISTLWKQEFSTVQEKLDDILASETDFLKNIIFKIRGHIYAINGSSKDLIDEATYPNGLISIRVGGNKLSRGLTLPGLSVSYFLRSTRMYDTLMQMGRWFGYRDRYEDLCKIYTTGKLYNWYGHVSMASEDFRERVKSMSDRDITPMEYQQQIERTQV